MQNYLFSAKKAKIAERLLNNDLQSKSCRRPRGEGWDDDKNN